MSGVSGVSGLSAAAGMVGKVDASNAVSVAVAAKALDQARADGAAVNQMIRSAGEVQRKAGAAAARAGGIDTVA